MSSICTLLSFRFFPNVIGAIDDIHLEIKITEERRNADSYYCWKLFHSIHLQVSKYVLTVNARAGAKMRFH